MHLFNKYRLDPLCFDIHFSKKILSLSKCSICCSLVRSANYSDLLYLDLQLQYAYIENLWFLWLTETVAVFLNSFDIGKLFSPQICGEVSITIYYLESSNAFTSRKGHEKVKKLS